MLTVKYVDPEGPERVFAVKEIEFVAPGYGYTLPPCQLGRSQSKGQLRFIYADGSDYYVYGGTVYAMNENGKTVAKYDLGGEKLHAEGTVTYSDLKSAGAAILGNADPQLRGGIPL